MASKQADGDIEDLSAHSGEVESDLDSGSESEDETGWPTDEDETLYTAINRRTLQHFFLRPVVMEVPKRTNPGSPGAVERWGETASHEAYDCPEQWKSRIDPLFRQDGAESAWH